MPKTLQIQFTFQTYIPLFICLWLYHVVVFVASFQVTKSSQSGDTIFGYLDDVSYATYTSTGKEQASRQRDQHDDRFQSSMLVPISTKPLLLVSSGSPLLSKRQCELLSLYYSQKTSHDRDTEMSEGKRVLETLQKYLDELIARHENTIVEPRYLFYDKPKLEPESQPTEKSESMLSLWNKNLPDGLHVDTNNGKYFRYLTILVYLTDSHAATVFPLANLDDNNNHNTKHRNILLANAADYLIRNDIHHTRQVVEPPPTGSSGSGSSSSSDQNDDKSDFYYEMIEDIKCKQALIENATITTVTKSGSGVRVVPQQGHVAIFANIDTSTGRADPYSFHGSELATDEKQVLTFFYEIPIDQFKSQLQFGQQVEIRLKQIKQKYF